MVMIMMDMITVKKNTVKTFCESDCVLHAECEWHADEMACEDAEGDHDDMTMMVMIMMDMINGDEEHCEDFWSERLCRIEGMQMR